MSIYKRRFAIDFDTKEELEDYKKKHKVRKDTELKVKPKEVTEKSREIDLTRTNENAGSHGQFIFEKQLTDDSVVTFMGTDGKVKRSKVKDLSDEERKIVSDTIKVSKLIHSEGFSDYSKVDRQTFEKNKENVLAFIGDDEVQLKKNTRKTPVKDRADGFIEDFTTNAEALMYKYEGGMRSPTSRKAMNDFLDKTKSVIKEAISDGSLGDISESDLDEYLQEDLKRLFFQEVETRRRSMGDHGIRHLVGNAVNSVDILDKLKQGGVDSITGKDKLLAMSTMVNHDIGYTLGQVAIDASKGGFHKSYSGLIAFQEKDRYAKIFGQDGMKKMVGDVNCYSNGQPMLYHEVKNEEGKKNWVPYDMNEAYDEQGNLKLKEEEFQNCKIFHGETKGVIQYHDSSNYDWKNDPIGSSVALADCTALFGKDKVQEYFYKNDDAMREVAKMQCILTSDISDEEKEKAFQGFKREMKAQIESLGDATEIDKDLLHSQINEMTIGKFSTIDDILTRSSGVLDGFEYDSKNNTMVVNTTYSEEGNILENLFGSEQTRNQWAKLYKDIKGSGRIEVDEDGNQHLFKGDENDPNESKILVKINKFSGEEINSKGVFEVYNNVPSLPIKQSLLRLSESVSQLVKKGVQPDDKRLVGAIGKINTLQEKMDGKCEDGKTVGESVFGSKWEEVKKLFEEAKRGVDISQKLMVIGLTDKEKAYLFSAFKTASLNRIAMRIAAEYFINGMALKMAAEEMIRLFRVNLGILRLTFETQGEIKILMKGHLFVCEWAEREKGLKEFEDFLTKHRNKIVKIKTEDELEKFLNDNRIKYKRKF